MRRQEDRRLWREAYERGRRGLWMPLWMLSRNVTSRTATIAMVNVMNRDRERKSSPYAGYISILLTLGYLGKQGP